MLINTRTSINKSRTPIPPIVNKRKVLFDFLIENAYAEANTTKLIDVITIASRIEYPKIGVIISNKIRKRITIAATREIRRAILLLFINFFLLI